MHPTCACALIVLCSIVRTQQSVNFTVKQNNVSESLLQENSELSPTKHNETSFSEENYDKRFLPKFTSPLSKTKNDLWDKLVYYFKKVLHANETVNTSSVENDDSSNDYASDEWTFSQIQSDQAFSELDDVSLSSLEGLADDEIWQRLIRKSETEDHHNSYHDYESVPDHEDELTKSERAETEHDALTTKLQNSADRLIINLMNASDAAEGAVARKRHTTHHGCDDANCSRTSTGNTSIGTSTSKQNRYEPVREIKLADVDKFLGTEFQNDASRTAGPKDAKGSSSLAIVFDTTGSMWDDLVQVRHGIKSIIATMLERPDKPIQDYVLVPFHDPKILPVTVTTDHRQLMQALDSIDIYGGTDCPEMVVGAIQQALIASRPNSYIYVFTDARAKDYHLVNQVLPLIERKQSQVVFVMTGDCGDRTHPGYTVFQQIAATSSGQVYHLNKSDVDEVLTFVKVSLNSHKVNLLSVDRPAALSPEHLPLAVDETLKEFTVSVSGKNPKIGVVDPKGQETLPPRLQPLLDLQNVKVVNVKEPDPGVWTLKVESESQHTVRTTGLSGSDFIYGFSVIPTTNMAETNHRPLESAMNSVLVRATEPDHVHSLTTLEVTYINGSQANIIELHPVPGQPGVYSGGPFVPPTEFFYLGINGFGKNNSILKRITPTAISSQNPELPFVTMVPSYSGQSGHSLTLRCNVESLVPISVRWFKDGASKSRALKYNQTAEVPLHLDDVTKKDEGSYICRASNVAGTSYKETKIIISGPPPKVETDNRVSGTVKKDVTLQCNVNSDSPYNVTWSRIVDSVGSGGRKHVLQIEPLQDTPRFSVAQTNNLIISPALPSDQGWYICSAQNDGGQATGRVYLTLEEIPAVRILPQKADFRTGTSFAVRCHIVSGIPFPTITWKKDGHMIEDSVTRRGEFVWEVVVRNSQNKDEGNYTCEAENSAGTASDTGHMRYIEAPEIIAEENTKLVKEGEAVSLRCMVRGIPTPQISWYKETQPIKQNTSSKTKLMEDGSLQISSVEDLDAGQYSCVAENQLGASHDFIDLQVGTSPRIVQLPADTNIPIGSSGSILCASIGLPVPQITWTKHGMPLDRAHFEINDSGRLKIKDASIEDEGTYTCSVENMFGKKTFSADVKITGIVPPKLAEERIPSVTKALFGESVQLVCPISEGNPVPTRKWYKDGERLDMNSINTDIFIESDGSLTINKMTAHNTGQYECVVHNVGGEDKIITNLQAFVPPRIIDETTQPLNKVIQGGDVILSCQVEGDPLPEVFWVKNGQQLPLSRQKGMELLIENATIEDDGKYLCLAGNSAGTATKAFQLDVLVPPKIMEWDSTVNVTSGNEVELDCQVEADPPAQISWFRGQELLPYTTSKVRFPVNKTNEGQYSCTAENDAGMVSKHLNLFVYLPPTFVVDEIADPPIMKVILGEDVILKCPVQGDPLPEISWLKDGQPLPNSRQVENELRIVKAKKDDNGKYICIATNEAGTATKTVELEVFSPPVISNWKNAMNVTKNEEVTLNCEVESYPPANISWYHDQHLLPFHSHKIKFTVNKTGEGQYSCRAENEAGVDRKYVNLFVAVPPEIHPSTPRHVKGVAGEEAILECNVYGDPPPQVSWIKDGFPISRMDEDDTSLTLANLTTIHSGTYICTAANSAGVDTREVSLVVMVGPKITKWEENLDVIAGQGVTLYCEVIADPPYHITWFKDGQQLEAYGQTLRFAAKADDSGIYTCMAENEAGTDRQDITVAVTVPAYISPSKEETVSVIAGSDNDVRFVCNADGIPAPSIFWIKNSANITEDDHFILEGNTLLIHNATSDMSGTYICDAENPGGIAQKVFNFNVYECPKILDTYATQVQLREGDDYSLACTASGIPNPHISWQKGKVQLAAGHHDDEILVMQDNTLVLTSASLKTSGMYSCVAENIAGMDSRNYTVDVLVPPVSMDSSVTRVEILESNTGVLTCPTNKGTPRPQFQWLKDDYPINFTAANVRADDVHYNLKDGGRSLKIVEARPDDNGIYTCIASNLAGRTQTSFAVEVLVHPHFIEDFPETRFTRTEGEELILDCSIEGNPVPKVSWKRVELGLPVTEHTAPGVIVQAPLRQKLRIPNVKRHHAGTYQCSAANKVGRETRQFRLNVIAKPELDGPAEEHWEVVKGESVVLQCRVFGAPTPKITWTYSNAMDTMKITNTGRDWRLLELNNVTSEKSGIYSCTGENTAGSVTKLFNVTVLEPPYISKVDAAKDGKVREGEDLTLTCNAYGVPEPAVTWLYSGHVIANATKTGDNMYVLYLPSVRSTSGGKYTCVASNKAGVAESSYGVRILVAPKLSKHRWNHANDKIASLEGLPLIIKCPVTGSPIPDISWMKNDIPLNVNREMLHIGTARKEHAGNYTCVATNNAGNISKSFLVDVLVAPKFLDEDLVKSLQVLSNSTLQLDCSVKGHPIPSLIWLRGTDPIKAFLGPHTYFINFNQTLVMEHVGIDQSAVYSCLASNIAGAMEKNFHLEVLEPPSMDEGMVRNGTISEMKVLLHRKVVIECPLSGSPEPNITWYKDGVALNHAHFSENRRELHIMSASIEDAGNYTCLAENQVGLKELLFNLKVVVPLKWSEWSAWNSCSVSCGGGKATRVRNCGKEEPAVKHKVQYDKAACQGDSTESRSCNAVPCQVAGNWGVWSSWTSCSETCGRATRRRYRFCDSPPPSYGGVPCIGSDAQQEYCLMGPCPVAAYWGEWSEWTPCSVSCNRGTKVRERRCIRGDDGETTTVCDGQDHQEVPCNVRRCPEDGKWSSWGEWSMCSVSCSRGTRRRIRSCIRSRFGGLPCKGDNVEIEKCRLAACNKISDRPKSASLKVKGMLNGEELQDTYIDANINHYGSRQVVTATLEDILKQQAGWFPYLTFLLPPVSWNSANELENANNGYSLTNGNFNQESRFQFATGEELVVNHAGRGINKDGALQVDIEVTGKVPLVEPRASVVINPYTEDYVQTGPNSLYAASHGNLDIDGHRLPYKWNKTVQYDTELGTMPYLVERMSTRDIRTRYNPKSHEIKFEAASDISRIYDKDKCPQGFKLDMRHQHCTDIDECQEARLSVCHHSQICENHFGSYKCVCRKGFRLSHNGRRCVDINECAEDNPCSHNCQNTKGSYRCLCPRSLVLDTDGVTCTSWRGNDDYRETEDNDYYDEGSQDVSSMGDYIEHKQAQEQFSCKPGYILNGETCTDFDECSIDGTCKLEETCINLIGSHQCLDTPCPSNYELDLETRKCMQLCGEPGVNCSWNASVAEIMSFTAVPLSGTVHPYQDIITLVGKGLKDQILPRTVFTITENESVLPLRVRIESGHGVLYAMKYFELQDICRVTILASSFDTDNKLQYATNFVVYIYSPDSVQL